MIEDNNYSLIASPYTSEVDKMKAKQQFLKDVMPGAFMTTNYYPYFSTHNAFMSERCSKNWDEDCELYLNNFLNIDEAKNFLDKTALRKYTTFDKKNSMPSCHPVYEQADPLVPQSEFVSSIPGAQSFYKNEDGGIRYTQPSLSPTYRVSCQDDTNNLKPKYNEGDFTENDGLFQNCMRYRACGESINLSDKTKTIYETRISKTRNNINKTMPNMQNYAVYEKPFLNSYIN